MMESRSLWYSEGGQLNRGEKWEDKRGEEGGEKKGSGEKEKEEGSTHV